LWTTESGEIYVAISLEGVYQVRTGTHSESPEIPRKNRKLTDMQKRHIASQIEIPLTGDGTEFVASSRPGLIRELGDGPPVTAAQLAEAQRESEDDELRRAFITSLATRLSQTTRE